jgi:uncharacterized integral membrane protein
MSAPHQSPAAQPQTGQSHTGPPQQVQPQAHVDPPANGVDPPTNGVDPSATTSDGGRVPHTRAGTVWIGICGAALTFVVLIIFMLQNTRSVEINFLWLHGSLPLAMALLIAGVGTAILTMIVGAVRITQLHRLAGRRQRGKA